MIHGKLQIFFQMFSQISRTPDFERSFRVKRCGLYAGVYGSQRNAFIVVLRFILFCNVSRAGTQPLFLMVPPSSDNLTLTIEVLYYCKVPVVFIVKSLFFVFFCCDCAM